MFKKEEVRKKFEKNAKSEVVCPDSWYTAEDLVLQMRSRRYDKEKKKYVEYAEPSDVALVEIARLLSEISGRLDVLNDILLVKEGYEIWEEKK